MSYNHKVMTILQHNCNRSTNVMQGLMDSGVRSDIIAIQEPWIGKIGKRKRKTKKNEVSLGGGEVTVGNRNFDIIYKQGDEHARVMWMVRKDMGLKYEIRDDVWEHPDTSIIDVEIEGGENEGGKRRIRIVNIYNQAVVKSDRGGWCMKKMPRGVGRGQPTVILGDMNTTGGPWDSREEPTTRAREIEEQMEEEEVELLNETERTT